MARYEDDGDKVESGKIRIHTGVISSTGDELEGSVIPRLIQEQNNELLRLREVVGVLIEKIAPVLGPERPGPSESHSEDVPDYSEVARVITSHTELATWIRRYVESTISRVEL